MSDLSSLDPTAASRKSDHIEMALANQVPAHVLDRRFYYEPLLAAHPSGALPETPFLDKRLRAPLWVSSMTGGTALANTINHNLARACAEFGMGMGLGSCRQLLYDDQYLRDFDVRDTIGASQPLFANLGVAQIEQLGAQKETGRIGDLVRKLRADGLIIHINPFQEALQPEGDRFSHAPLEWVEAVLAEYDFPVIVKEVGQGFGPESLKKLLELPLAAIEFAAGGGTNFALIELLRSDILRKEAFESLARTGHSAAEMLDWVNHTVNALGRHEIKTRHLIISGGIQDFLDGYYLTQKSVLPAVYGQAGAFLRHARGDYDALKKYTETQIEGLKLAHAYLRCR